MRDLKGTNKSEQATLQRESVPGACLLAAWIVRVVVQRGRWSTQHVSSTGDA